MPKYIKTVKFYACNFRCGYGHSPQEVVARHEAWCWKDPRWRTCITCKFSNIYDDDYKYRCCDRKNTPDIYYNMWIEAYVEYETEPQYQRMPLINCPYWNDEYNGSCSPYIAEKNIHYKKPKWYKEDELPF